MKYLKSMEIVNFQSHEHSKLDFVNGLNVISGPSDNGKSAIIRALKWVLYNEPKGTDFIRQGESTCRVKIVLSDDTVIIRERSKSKNLYKLINPSGEESIFEGFGNDIPQEVLSAHGINRFYIDSTSSDSINLAEQLEGPFLISQSGSIKAKAIGRLVGVNIIDEALKELNKDLNAIQNEEKRLEKDLGEKNEKLKEFSYLENVKKNIDKKEILLDIIKRKFDVYKKLEKVQKEYSDIQENISALNSIVKSLGQIEEASILNKSALEKVGYVNRLISIQDKLQTIEGEITKEKEVINRTKNVEEALIMYISLQDRIKSYQDYSSILQRYISVKRDMEAMSKIASALENVDGAVEKHNRIYELLPRLEKIKEYGDKILAVEASISKGKSYLGKLQQVDEADILYEKILRCIEKHNVVSTMEKKYNLALDEYSSVKNILKEQLHLVNTITEEYIDTLTKIGKCPVCLAPIESHTMDQIIKEFRGDEKYE